MKKIVLFTFLLLTSVFTFAKEHTIVSFNIQYKNNAKDTRIFQNAFRYLVDKNDADIVLLQEVYIGEGDGDEERVKKFFTDILSKSWNMYTTYGCLSVSKEDKKEAKKEPKNTQHNAILFNRSNFKTVEYLNNGYNTKRNDENNMCKSTFNNVQAVKFITKDNKTFFVVNAHVSPHGNFTFNSDTKHRRDFDRLKDFIQTLAEEGEKQKNVPVILGGDMNFTTIDLKDFFDREVSSNREVPSIRWIVDGNEDELYTDPWLTTVKGEEPYDHFIFNIDENDKKSHFKIIKKEVPNFTTDYSMRLGFEKLKDNEIEGYTDNISDHYPICITIESK